MPVARLYQFTIHERDKEQFESSSSFKATKRWNIVLRNPLELKEKIISHAMADGFDKQEQCKIGILKIGLEELPYYLVFRNANDAGREYSLKSGENIIDIDDIF